MKRVTSEILRVKLFFTIIYFYSNPFLISILFLAKLNHVIKLSPHEKKTKIKFYHGLSLRTSSIIWPASWFCSNYAALRKMNREKWWRQSVFVYRLERYFVHFNPVGDSVSSFDFFQLFIFPGYCYLWELSALLTFRRCCQFHSFF